MKRFISLISLAGVLALVGGCAKEEDPVQHEPQASEDVFVTLSSGVRFAPDTRAITEDGVKTFGQDDRIAVVYTNTNNEPATAVSGQLVISEDGKSASFTVLLQNPKEGEVSYVYPSTMADESALSAQDGTFAGLQALDYAKGTGEITGSGANAQLPSGMVLTNQLAVVKFTIKDEDGTNDITANLIGLTASDGTSAYHINREAGPGPIYLALRPASGDIKFTAFDATQNYVKFLHGKTLSAGSLYPIVLQMPVVTPPVNAIRGLFTVNEAGTQVYFSRGNLRATGTAASTPESGWTWSFAEHQYDAVGNSGGNSAITGNGTVSGNATIDLFALSSTQNYFGILAENTDDAHFFGAYMDWGILMGDGWRLLTRDEWNYLCYGRPNAAHKMGLGRIGNQYGLFLLPDVFTDPKTNSGTLSVGGAFIEYKPGAKGEDLNYYTVGGNWEAMEASGAVFMPNTFIRSYSGSIANYHHGNYWTAMPNPSSDWQADFFYFEVSGNSYDNKLPVFNNIERSVGQAVRLVNRVSPIIDLSQLTSDYQAMDGDVLINTLATDCRISVAPGATITLRDANINGSDIGTGGEYAGLTCEGDATIILEGTSVITGFRASYPGISIAPEKTLTIKGAGSLTARSDGTGAGIGGKEGLSAGNILIKEGTVFAQSYQGGAGIGSGQNGTCGNITIEGGNVTAIGGRYAAGIGSGCAQEYDVHCGDITISGGKVNAQGGEGAPGIGSGMANSNMIGSVSECGNISITAGTVDAMGGGYSSAIGSGCRNFESAKSNYGSITISPGIIRLTATKGDGAVYSVGMSGYDTGIWGDILIGGLSYTGIVPSPWTYPVTGPAETTGGIFSVSATQQVYFAPGNLQATYDGSSWTWSIAANPWDIVGNNAANNAIDGSLSASENGTVDLFGWNGASSEYDNYGINNSTTWTHYGNVAGEELKHDWGSRIDGSVWYTLSADEWDYLINQRVTPSGVRFAKGWIEVNSNYKVRGIILFPDNWSRDYYPVTYANDKSVLYNKIMVTPSQFESRYGRYGAVFLPANEHREGNSVTVTSVYNGHYWCRNSHATTSSKAYLLYFSESYSDRTVDVRSDNRYKGFCVRLVQNAHDL